MFPWDFDRHLDLLHSKCKVCQQYLVNEEMDYRIAILQSKVRPETFLKLVNAIQLPNTDLTVIQRSEPEVGLNVDEERI